MPNLKRYFPTIAADSAGGSAVPGGPRAQRNCDGRIPTRTKFLNFECNLNKIVMYLDASFEIGGGTAVRGSPTTGLRGTRNV